MSSLTEQPAGVVIKSARTGRTQYSQQYKQEVLAAFETSSLSAPDFARQCGIKYPTFASWVAAQKRPARTSSCNAPAFLVAEVADVPDHAALEVQLPGGAIACAAGSSQIRLLAELLHHLA